MKWCRSNGRVLTLMMALAFFNFIFLGIEYQFDNMMAMVTGPEQVVTAQGYVLGASVLGFLLPGGCFLYKRKILAERCGCRSTGRGDLYFCNLAA